jgi:hypothetical protein
MNEMTSTDLVTRYVTALTAKQLVRHIMKQHTDFRREHTADFKALTQEISNALKSRTEITIDRGKRESLKWFEGWFLRPVRPLEEVEKRLETRVRKRYLESMCTSCTTCNPNA